MTFGMPFLLELDTVSDAACLCRDLGLAFVELNANFPACQVERLDAAELRALSATYGVGFTLHIEEECDPFTFNRAVRQAWLEGVARAIHLARAAGMPIVNMHLPKGVYITLPTEKAFLYQRYRAEFHGAIREFLALVDREIGDSGVKLCIENTSGWQPHEREAIDLLLTSPHIGLTLDVGHSHGTGDVDEDYFLAHLDRLRHMHGHDARGKQNHLALGDGEIDLRARFALARQCSARVVLETKTIAALTESVRKLEIFL